MERLGMRTERLTVRTERLGVRIERLGPPIERRSRSVYSADDRRAQRLRRRWADRQEDESLPDSVLPSDFIIDYLLRISN